MIPHRAIFKRPNLGSERPDFRSGRPEVPELVLETSGDSERLELGSERFEFESGRLLLSS